MNQAEGTNVTICVNKVLMRIECSKEEVMNSVLVNKVIKTGKTLWRNYFEIGL